MTLYDAWKTNHHFVTYKGRECKLSLPHPSPRGKILVMTMGCLKKRRRRRLLSDPKAFCGFISMDSECEVIRGKPTS